MPPFLKRNVKKAKAATNRVRRGSHPQWTRRNNLFTMKSLKRAPVKPKRRKPVVMVPVDRNLRKYRPVRMVPIHSTIKSKSLHPANQYQYRVNQWNRGVQPYKENQMVKRIQKMVRARQSKKRDHYRKGFRGIYDAAYGWFDM